MPNTRNTAVVLQDLSLRVEFHHVVTGAAVDPAAVDQAQLLDTDGVTPLQTIVPPNIVKIAVGVYEVTFLGANLDVAGVYFDKWTFRFEALGDPPQTATLQTTVGTTAPSQGHAVGFPVARRVYTCAAYLTKAGVSLVGLTTDDVAAVIADASEYIEVLTGGQMFCPVPDTRVWDGNDSNLIFDAFRHKILDVTSVEVDSSRVVSVAYGSEYSVRSSGFVTVAAADYVVKDRLIAMIGTKWPTGHACVRVTGTFGWLEPARTKVATTLAANLAPDAQAVTVTSTAGIEAGDTVLIGNSVYVMVLSVVSATVLSCDKVAVPISIGAGASVVTWGRTPRAITQLANHITAQFIDEQTSRVDAQRVVDAQRIRKETTDRYSYELFSPSELGAGGLTGSIRHDMTVHRFSTPAVVLQL